MFCFIEDMSSKMCRTLFNHKNKLMRLSVKALFSFSYVITRGKNVKRIFLFHFIFCNIWLCVSKDTDNRMIWWHIQECVQQENIFVKGFFFFIYFLWIWNMKEVFTLGITFNIKLFKNLFEENMLIKIGPSPLKQQIICDYFVNICFLPRLITKKFIVW